MFGQAGAGLKTGQDFSGAGIAVYLGAAAAALIGVLYGLYVQRVSFDLRGRILAQRKGFAGRVRTTRTPFSRVECVDLCEAAIRSEVAGNSKLLLSWNISLRVRGDDSPTFALWRATDLGTARHVARSLADAVGCPARERLHVSR